MKALLILLISLAGLCFTGPAAAADWIPDPADPRQIAAAQEIERMLLRRPELQAYFDAAYGYAIFPNVGRIAFGWGFVYGRGIVVEQDRVVGTTSQVQGALGFDFGAQWHSQVIFFQTKEIMNEFKSFGLEFQGRSSAVLITAGLSADPAYKPPVAIFSRTRAGLMVEIAAHAAKYFYRPLEPVDKPSPDSASAASARK